MCLRVSDIIGSVRDLAGYIVKTHEIAAAIALLENIFRKLLLVEAAHFVRDVNVARRPHPSRHSEFVEERRDAPQPSVRLTLAPRCTPSPRPRKRALRSAEASAPNTERLVQKFEALRRAIETPAPHIRRLARILTRRCRVNADASAQCAIAPPRPHYVDPYDGRLIVEVIALALLAAPAFVNSS